MSVLVLEGRPEDFDPVLIYWPRIRAVVGTKEWSQASAEMHGHEEEWYKKNMPTVVLSAQKLVPYPAVFLWIEKIQRYNFDMEQFISKNRRLVMQERPDHHDNWMKRAWGDYRIYHMNVMSLRHRPGGSVRVELETPYKIGGAVARAIAKKCPSVSVKLEREWVD